METQTTLSIRRDILQTAVVITKNNEEVSVELSHLTRFTTGTDMSNRVVLRVENNTTKKHETKYFSDVAAAILYFNTVYS